MPKQHPRPTEATVKYLYAHAFSCGFPDCREPLFKVDSATLQPHLNSRMCHIHARREGGPRWDDSLTAGQNRHRSNLILMCEAHASQIDDMALVAAYPPKVLQDWKRIQADEFERIQTGWALGKEAARTIRSGDGSPTIRISNSIIELGGKGGAAPGAGGGGGGAIGPGSRGGRGGKGGDVHVDEGPFTNPWLGSRNYPDLSDLAYTGAPPGAGGGGGAPIGTNAIGGDGGDGGDAAMAIIDIQALREAGFCGIAEVEVGEGGKGAYLPGQLPESGGVTAIRFRHHDGTLLKEVKVRGGASAGPRLPNDFRELNANDIAAGIQVTALMPVNSAEIRDGLAYILGGDWRFIEFTEFPSDLVVIVFCSLRWLEGKIAHEKLGFHLVLRDPTGKRIAQHALTLDFELGDGGVHKWLLPIGAPVREPGEYAIQLISGEFLLSETLVSIRQVNQI